MTLIAGLRCSDAVVLAADSQVTVEGLKMAAPKLFRTPQRIIWGIAGPILAAQALEIHFKNLILEGNPGRDAGRKGIRDAITGAVEDLKGPHGESMCGRFEGLFAWHADDDESNYLLKANSNGAVEFMHEYGAVGSSGQIAGFAFFGFSSTGFLEFETLPVEAAKMLAHTVTDNAVRASAQGVDGPIQLAVVTATEATVLDSKDLQPVQDTATAFKMHQADFLKRTASPVAGEDARGLVPDGDD